MTKGVWKTLAELEDPELRKLAASLPKTVMHSRADSTTRKYMCAFQRWQAWAEPRQGITVYPVEEAHFALYLQHVGDTTKSKAMVEEAVNAISWVHTLSGLPPIAESVFVGAVKAGLQRMLAKPTRKKEPITPDMLRLLVNSMPSKPSLMEVRLVASSLLAYAAFLRFDELAKICCCDVVFRQDSMSVRIQSSKTDQYRKGDTVLVARTGAATCPVAMLECYVSMAGIDLTSRVHLFRGIVHTKQGEHLRASGALSYTRMRELFLNKLSRLGFDPKQFGLHSLRAGGALRQRKQGYQTACLKDTADGSLSLPRMAMWKTL